MYLLIRNISPYTGSDLLLGVFSTLELAQQAKHTYQKHFKNHPDHYAEQAYHSVDLNKDLRIADYIPEYAITPSTSTLYIISFYSEDFGQIYREFKAICGNLAEAKAALNDYERQTQKYDFPSYYEIDTVELNHLALEAPIDE